jgi:hypothetical protein
MSDLLEPRVGEIIDEILGDVVEEAWWTVFGDYVLT